MKSDGEIYLKTDSRGMFEYSICEFSQCGYALKNLSLDLHSSGYKENIVTEHEKKYTDMYLPIYRLEAYLPTKSEI